MKDERDLAGLRCGQVLSLLSAYVDGELSDTELAQLRAHVAACDACERFGGQFGLLVRALREAASATNPRDEAATGAADDFVARLDRALG